MGNWDGEALQFWDIRCGKPLTFTCNDYIPGGFAFQLLPIGQIASIQLPPHKQLDAKQATYFPPSNKSAAKSWVEMFTPWSFMHDNFFSLSEKSTSLPELMNNGNVRTPSSSSQIFKPQPSHCQFLDHLLQQHKLAGLFQLLQPTRMVGWELGLPSLN